MFNWTGNRFCSAHDTDWNLHPENHACEIRLQAVKGNGKKREDYSDIDDSVMNRSAVKMIQKCVFPELF